MNSLFAVALVSVLALATGQDAASVPRQPETWTQAGGIIRLSIILFFAAVVAGMVGYAQIPPAAAKAAKVLFGVFLAVCTGLMIASIFVPGNPAQP